MKEIRSLRANQIRIYPTDEVDFASLVGGKRSSELSDRFEFQSRETPFGLPPEMTSALFVRENGQYLTVGKRYPIFRLAIEPRRIIVDIGGPSAVADAFYSEVKDLLPSIDSRSPVPSYDPLVTADETTCVVRLEFPPDRLFPQLSDWRIAELLESKAPSHGCALSVAPTTLKLRIRYQTPPDRIVRSHITLTDKEFLIELRENTASEDCIYLTQSPTRTEQHLAILAEIETAIRAHS